MRYSPITRRLTAAAMLVATALGTNACAAPGGSGDSTASTQGAGTPDTQPFVDCMRSHGLPDFPEVTVSSDGLVNFDIQGERVDTDSELYGAAVKACQSLLPTGTRLPGAPAAPSAPEAPAR